MKEFVATTFDEIIDEFRKYPKQRVLCVDATSKLRASWTTENADVLVTVRAGLIRRWTPELVDIWKDEGGRERMRKVIEKRAWPE